VTHRGSIARPRFTRLGRFGLLGLALLAAHASPLDATTKLDATERRLVAAIDRRAPASLELLQKVVDVNSGTMNFAGVREVARIFQPEFEALGFKVRWLDGTSWNRAGHLVARRDGKSGAPKLLLIGHLDTVFEKDSPFQRYARVDDSTARGPGIIDMKGGDVIILLALHALADAGALDRLSITVMLSGDEEHQGDPVSLARADLYQAADWADVSIGFEDGAGDPRSAVVARRGSSSWTLRTAGHPAHSSQIFTPEVGSGAIYEAGRILAAFHDSLSHETYLTVNPGLVLGGTTLGLVPEAGRGTAAGKTNVVPESTVVEGDLRAVSLEQRERAKEIMRRIVARHLPRTSATIVFDDGYPPLSPAPGNRRLLALYDRASQDLGLGSVEAVDPARAGAADVSFTEGRVEMALDGIGLMGGGGHTVEETADLRTLPSQAKRAAVLLWRLSQGIPRP
jgi:glutamate carboxypeptidase